MTPVSPQAATLTNGIVESLRKRAEAISREWEVRLNSAKTAFGAEMAWRDAQAKSTALEEATPALPSAVGLLIDLETRHIVRLQSGLNAFGNISVKVEGGSATLMDPGQRKAQALCSGETFSAGDRTFQVKLFSFGKEDR